VSIDVGGVALGDGGVATRSERAALHRAGVRMPLEDQAYVGYGRCALAKRMCLGVHKPSIADFDAGYARRRHCVGARWSQSSRNRRRMSTKRDWSDSAALAAPDAGPLLLWAEEAGTA